jgi:hypothetical protein
VIAGALRRGISHNDKVTEHESRRPREPILRARIAHSSEACWEETVSYKSAAEGILIGP